MKTKLEQKLKAAEASAVMIVENADELPGDLISADGFGEAETALVKAERMPSAVNACIAEHLCKKFLADNEAAALAAIEHRIARRAALANAPLSEGAKRALRGED